LDVLFIYLGDIAKDHQENLRMKQFIALAAVTVLTACGGGGGDAPAGTSVPPSTAVATSAEGFWNGTATDGTKISLGILETGETWGLSATARGTLLGVIYGNVTASGTSLAGTGSSFDFTTRTGSTSTFIGSFYTQKLYNVHTLRPKPI
jgi:hypothetical protein